jgi:hypothetical protein
MRLRHMALIALLALPLSQDGGPSARAKAGPRRPPPDVVLISIDTQRVDRLGVYGYGLNTSWYIDGLARESVVFEDHHSPAPLTLPSHISMLTGLLPPSHGVRSMSQQRLGDSATTLQEVLKAHGYRTAGIISAGVLHPVFGLSQGFDLYSGNFSGDNDRTQTDAKYATDRAIKWIDGLRKRDRSFLFVHYYDPHPPFEAPARFTFKDPYDCEVAYVDEQIGRLLAHLKRKGRYQNAVIVVTADHGESLGEHGAVGHTMFLFEQTLHVPLLVRLPGGRYHGRHVRTLTRGVDVMPTVLASVGLKAGVRLDGVDLTPLVRDGTAGMVLPSYAETLYGELAPLHEKSIIFGGNKLISFVNVPAGDDWMSTFRRLTAGLSFGTHKGKLTETSMAVAALPQARAVFELSRDRGERVNLYFSQPGLAIDLEKRLAAVRSPIPAEPLSLGARLMDQLRALGYAM